ncbi:MAG: hypothetical protein JNJ83_15125 [Verrucomicrobiaceae bacterium]|nr:hypothetical protein [Verrucomicrobiaceae bacterium]
MSIFSQGFDADVAGWSALSGTFSAVTSGTGGITSANGGGHAVATGTAFTRFGEYRSAFPSGGYVTSTKVYLDVSAGWANDRRFDWIVASSKQDGNHLRDYVFNVGFYNAADLTGPGAGTDRFVISASNNAGPGSSFPKNVARSPVAVSASGWYTFEHQFSDVGGALSVLLVLRDPSNAIVSTWTLSDPADLIASVVGGNRYGWLAFNTFSSLAIDTAGLSYNSPSATLPVLNVTRSWLHATINGAMTAATAGEVIRASDGNYTENVTINKNITLESTTGRANTTITGISGVGALGAVVVSGNTTGVTIGGAGKGFTIIGVDNNNPGLENAALYLQGGHTGLQVIDNDIRANGDVGLLSEFGAVISNWIISGNIFSGKTYVGANPADNGFGNQFSTPNVPRQLVVLGNGGGNLATATATNITFTNNSITGTAGGLNISAQEQGNQLVTLDVATSTITGNTFNGVTTRFAGSLRVRRPGNTISGNTFISTGLGINTSQIFVQNNTTTLQDMVAANIFDKGVYVDNSTTVGLSIQGFVNSVLAGTTIHVLPGTYREDVLVNKTVTLNGGGAATTTIEGIKGGDGATVRISASDVIVQGFTITREGNNPTDWNDGTLNSAGIAIQGAQTNALIRNNTITGNRSAVDINNSSGHSFLNNSIHNNHTGVIFRNQTDNIILEENSIVNNRTVGILFLDASGGTNSPVQTAANCQFVRNNISGNWYGQIVDRQSGGSLPAPGSNIKNFSSNWFGTATPVVSTANSAEPGYASLLPVVFGGTAIAPGGQPDICGPASANFDYTPLLSSGTDTDVESTLNRGTHGFQPDLSALVVTAQGSQSGTSSRIQEGIDRVATAGAVTILAGTYAGNVDSNTKSVTIHAGSGTDTAVIAVNGDLTLNSGVTLQIQVNGTTPGTSHDQWTSSGSVSIASAALVVSGSFSSPIATDSIIILDKTSGGAISGTFAGFAEGFVVAPFVGTSFATATYLGGNGNDFAFVELSSPPIITTGPVNVSAEAYTSFNLSAVAIGYPAPTFQWYLNNVPISGATSSILNVPFASLLTAGTYKVVATNTFGDDEATAVVTVTPKDVIATEDDLPLVDENGDPVAGGLLYRPMSGVLNNDGSFVIKAQALSGFGGVVGTSNEIVLTNASGSLAVVGREGFLAGGGSFSSQFRNLNIHASGLLTYENKINGVVATLDQGYLASEDGESLDLISQEGDVAPGGDGGVFSVHNARPAIAKSGVIYFGSQIKGGTTATSLTDSGIWYDDGSTLDLLAREGDEAPTVDPAWIGQIRKETVVAGASKVAFIATLQRNPADLVGGRTDSTLNEAVMVGEPGQQLELLARKGDEVAPGLKILTFTAVAANQGENAQEAHAILAKLARIGGITTATDDLLMFKLSGAAPEVIVREGDDIDGRGQLKKINEVFVTNDGKVVFRAQINTSAVTNQLICRWDNGVIDVLAQKGTPSPDGPNYGTFAVLCVSPEGMIAFRDTRAVWREVGNGVERAVKVGDTIIHEGTPRTVFACNFGLSKAVNARSAGGGFAADINDAGSVIPILSIGNGEYVVKLLP